MIENKIKVIYFINYAPEYRDVFLRELGKYVDLTVVSYNGTEANLKDPIERTGYKFICLTRKRMFGINYNHREFTLANSDYDVIIVGYTLWHPFRMINHFRPMRRVIAEGLIYGKGNSWFTKLLRGIFLRSSEGVLVYSELVKERLTQEIEKPIIVFNNTSYSKNDIYPLPINNHQDTLNVLWVGRYQKRKKVERLVELSKRNPKVNVRLVGPGLQEALKFQISGLLNITLFPEAYEIEIESHFAWAHCVFNPGGAGLLVMNAARFSRPIFIDKNSHHGPEIQLAIDSDQEFLDFSDTEAVDALVKKCMRSPNFLEKKGSELFQFMNNYTIEYMAQQYLKAIEGRWE